MPGVFPRKKKLQPTMPAAPAAPPAPPAPEQRPAPPPASLTHAPQDQPGQAEHRFRRSFVLPRVTQPKPAAPQKKTEPAKPEPTRAIPPWPPAPVTDRPTKLAEPAGPSVTGKTHSEARAKAPGQPTAAPNIKPPEWQASRTIDWPPQPRTEKKIAPGTEPTAQAELMPAKAPAVKKRKLFGLGGRREQVKPVPEPAVMRKPVDSTPEQPEEKAQPVAEPAPEKVQETVPEPPPKPTGPRLPLRVALDLRTWEMSGLGVYVRELLAAFARLNLPVRWTFIGPEELKEKLPRGLDIERWYDFNAPLYGSRSFLHYPKLRGVDLFHYPHYNLPLTRAPHRLVTVFDLFHLRYGSWGKRRYQSFFLRRLRWAGHTHLLTASAKTGRELMELGLMPRERIAMIPLGPGRMPARRAQVAPPVLNSLAGTPVRSPWMLVTGIDQPHKNFDFMLSALSLYFQRRPEAPPLVWVGLDEQSRKRRSRQLPAHVKQKVVLEPYTSDARLEAIYAGAGALLFPSLDEGFGFPPLEAMAWGIPVICSRREPMTAILDDAPLYFEPSESASLWRALDRLLDDPDLRQGLIRRGRQCADLYSWDVTAVKTFKLYAHLIGLDSQEAAAGGTQKKKAKRAKRS